MLESWRQGAWNTTCITVAKRHTANGVPSSGGLLGTARQTLKGTVIGNAAISGTLSPGEFIGTLTFNNNLTLSGITFIEINKGLNTNDQVLVAGLVTYGGTLSVTNLAGTLTTNDTFVLFSPGASASNFTNIIGSSRGGTGL